MALPDCPVDSPAREEQKNIFFFKARKKIPASIKHIKEFPFLSFLTKSADGRPELIGTSVLGRATDHPQLATTHQPDKQSGERERAGERGEKG